ALARPGGFCWIIRQRRWTPSCGPTRACTGQVRGAASARSPEILDSLLRARGEDPAWCEVESIPGGDSLFGEARGSHQARPSVVPARPRSSRPHRLEVREAVLRLILPISPCELSLTEPPPGLALLAPVQELGEIDHLVQPFGRQRFQELVESFPHAH